MLQEMNICKGGMSCGRNGYSWLYFIRIRRTDHIEEPLKIYFLNLIFIQARNRWYIKLTLIVSSAMLITSLAGFPRSMWIGIACMSVCLPFSKDIENRMGKRAVFNVVGCVIFMVLYLVLPESMYPYIGMIGGIGVGYSAGYAGQTAFNTFGALSLRRTFWHALCGYASYRNECCRSILYMGM